MQQQGISRLFGKRRRRDVVFLTRALLLALCLIPGAAPAEALQSLESIRQKVQAYLQENHAGLGENTRVEIGRLDRRLRLAACGEPLAVSSPYGKPRSGSVTLEVSCAGPKAWRLYVPARIESYLPVLSLSRNLPRGAMLKESDLQPLRQNIAALPHGYFTDAAELVGMELRRPLRAGAVVSPGAVKAPTLVRRGQNVRLVVESGGVRISSQLEALQDGAEGELIRLKNPRSGRIVQGRVSGRDTVRIKL
ncbi:flagellar basal body P-ring formation chaperone FlgA [Alkalilimnicola sp. S0819]|uniref:flagellar basal body P-ring formation chaperone FlgA n=1 Tax=Alkalilimnicola sp. S0819 TaxID=2613922 RepID=UPI0018699D87|nr:flagellar basal body P-ring formation chaperone FlgA [Alkalilimnicola sp. S0819]